MKQKLTFLTSLSLFMGTALAQEQSLSVGDDVAMADSKETLQKKLKPHCDSVSIIEREKVSYPLAQHTEHHLICSNYNKDKVHFDSAVFVLADNQFRHMEAQGTLVKEGELVSGEKMGDYLNMAVYDGGQYWLDEQQKRLLWLDTEALHPNLFAWHNPVQTHQGKIYSASSKIPSLLDFASDIEALRPQFEKQCKYVKEDKIDKVWLPNTPREQIQINCFGFEYAGFERKFEAVFGDGKLQVVWILTAKQEEQRIREQLIADWGQTELNNKDWEVFAGGKISLRKDKPEILLLSDEMVPLYQKRFKGS